MLNQEGRKRKLLAGNVKGIFRIIQAITSPKAEPLKVWLATAGYEYQKTFHNYHQFLRKSLFLPIKKGIFNLKSVQELVERGLPLRLLKGCRMQEFAALPYTLLFILKYIEGVTHYNQQ